MRKSVGAAVAAVLSAGGLLLGTGAAQAAGLDIPRTVTTDGNPGGSAEFKSYGDILVACDNQSDGYGTRATLYNSAGNVLKTATAYDNDPSCVGNYADLPEGLGVRLTVCLYKGGIYTYFCRTSAWGVS